MDISAQEQRRAFGVWLRTGRWPRLEEIRRIETKYNPWHDILTGRFTFAGTGRHVSSDRAADLRNDRNWGGAGANGSWSDDPPKPQKPSRNSPRAVQSSRPTTALAKASALAKTTPAAVDKLQRIVRNGYEFQIDARHRTRRVSGTLTLNGVQPRSRTAQTQAGGSDRRPSDDGGHYIARRFNGPTEAFNHFAQDANFNRGGYRALEDKWGNATRNGKRVLVAITPLYDGISLRPATLRVGYTIDSVYQEARFPNESREARRGK